MTDLRKYMDAWFQQVWGEGNVQHIHDCCDIDMTTSGHRGIPLRGPDEFKQFYHMITALTENININIVHSVENDDWISAIYRFKGEKKASGEPVEMTGSTMVRIVEGKILEVYEHVDFITFFENLGALPCETLECCLKGKTMVA